MSNSDLLALVDEEEPDLDGIAKLVKAGVRLFEKHQDCCDDCDCDCPSEPSNVLIHAVNKLDSILPILEQSPHIGDALDYFLRCGKCSLFRLSWNKTFVRLMGSNRIPQMTSCSCDDELATEMCDVKYGLVEIPTPRPSLFQSSWSNVTTEQGEEP